VSGPSKRTAIVAEKPSVARDIAAVVGATKRGDGFIEGNGYVVTWAIGHLIGIAEPGGIHPAWKPFRLDTLPMLPKRWPLVVLEGTKSQFEIVRKILLARDVDRVVCATDAGREGELIFRLIYEAAGAKKPVSRLWISSLTDQAIKDGLSRLRPSRDFDGLADAARGRSRADWLVGMNLSRAYSLVHDDVLSVGRVQTPTLAMVVARDEAIRNFVPEDYLEVVATFDASGDSHNGSEAPATYRGVWFRPAGPKELPPEERELSPEQRKNKARERARKTRRLPPDGEMARAIIDRARTGKAEVSDVRHETRRMPPPLLYDLTELQRHANRLYSMSAQHTLDVLQALYETHKVITYPRTDARHLSTDVERELDAIITNVALRYPGLVAPGSGQRPLGKRFVDDARVTDHHAILPTATPARALNRDEERLYDLICRRLLAAYHGPYIESVTAVLTRVVNASDDGPIIDTYASAGVVIEDLGWKALDVGKPKPIGARKPSADEEDEPDPSRDQALPAGLSRGKPVRVIEAQAVKKRTKPPPRLNDATLLTAMETAGRALDDKELSDAMRERGLGTPATRASILETLLKRELLTRNGKALEATEKGAALVARVHPTAKSPELTGEWEAKLAKVQRGELSLEEFMRAVEAWVAEVVGEVKGGAGDVSPRVTPSFPKPESNSASATAARERPKAASSKTSKTPSNPDQASLPLVASAPAPARAPTTDLRGLLADRFGFASFRRHQEEVCRAAASGRDVLLVMPTGAGKSLCYQLPGIARGGTTLVVSPLIALMDDQADKLLAQGFKAERIHSGRDRSASRAACVAYLKGELDFLFIAPERLGVSGFPEMLAKRPPSLIAIDEAHCISQWGHDFRPDYRLLGSRLPALRPAPIVALTATATPRVQRDIEEQLGLTSAARFIHGFRRDNLAIEIAEVAPSARPDAIAELLSDASRRPAIVYAATRKSTEELAKALGKKRGAAYHAGMDQAERARVQSRFLGGELDVIVATIAFGMGIDKPDVRTVVHAALPGSVEGYYQEIGRAGRDGKPSKAVLLHGFADRKTHEFFLERDYPAVEELRAIVAAVGPKGVSLARLRSRGLLGKEGEDRSLDRLVQVRAVIVASERKDEDDDAEVRVRRGEPDWEATYNAQRAHRVALLDDVARFVNGTTCRMVALVRHFGDQADDGARCGQCDICAPSTTISKELRAPNRAESSAIAAILATLKEDGELASGRLYREAFPKEQIDRRTFQHLLASLERERWIAIEEAEFEKDGESIRYQRVSITPLGEAKRGDEAVSIAAPIARPARARSASSASSSKAFFVRRAQAAKAQAKKSAGGPPSSKKGGKRKKKRGKRGGFSPS
jgi:DNA topoisomerase-3